MNLKKRGYVNITQIGLYEFKQNKNFTEDILFKNPVYAEWRGKPQKLTPDSTPEENIKQAFSQINERLAEELLDKIIHSNPFFFEKIVVDLLLKMGYGNFQKDAGFTTRESNDEGIDGIINQDVLGLDKIAIQAKRYDESNKIGKEYDGYDNKLLFIGNYIN